MGNEPGAGMRISIFLPGWGSRVTTAEFDAVARAADELGFHALWVGDHIVFPETVSSPYPYGPSDVSPFDADKPLFEPLTLLSYLAGRTHRVLLGISVLVLPLRNPVSTAKMLAGLDILSGGRLVVGVGAGWMEEEFEALDADFSVRGEVTDEWLDILRHLWSGAPAGFTGVHYSFDPVGFVPHPRRVPVVVGGNSPAARRRAAGSDGWHPLRLDTDTLAAGVADARRRAGERSADEPFTVVYRGPVVPDDAVTAGPDALADSGSGFDRYIDELERIGVDELIVELPGVTGDVRLAWMSWIAKRTFGS